MADQKSQQIAEADAGPLEATEFDALLRKEFKPKTDEAKEAVERAVRTLAEQALSADHADQRRRRRIHPGHHRRSSTGS